ncbi:MAG TPA: hypothetical protein PKE16_08185 [Hyphomicrobium sp.]|nr:hypothetical protein [Hyphomicrobium sp.]
MAVDGDQPLDGGTRPSSLLRKLVARVKAHAFLQALGIRRGPVHAATPQSGSEGPEQNVMMRASEYLEICQENALDAYTVEDALYWHNEIITELSIELNLVQASRWPQTVKANMAATLEDRLTQHAAAVTRLTAVLEDNKVFKWQP